MKEKLERFKRYIDRFALQKSIVKMNSQHNPDLEVVGLGDKLMLNAANTNYSFGGLHRVFQRAFKKTAIGDRKIHEVLVLGFGAGSVASIIRDELKMESRITGVELDPVVIEIGKTYFGTNDYSNLEIVQADAASYIQNEKKLYDLIVVDVYVDFNVPAECETQEFINHLRRCLAPKGLILFNKMIYNNESRIEAGNLEERFNKLPGKTSVVKIREGMLNKIIIFENERKG